MPHTVAIADLDTKPHNRCFEDFARALTAALADLGQDVGLDAGRLIILGANDASSRAAYPDDAIFFNAEQVAVADDPERLLAPSTKDRVIWDYSRANIARWRELGYRNVVHCPVGYHPSMSTIVPAAEDVDVLHYGWLTPRRKDVLLALQRAGLSVMHLDEQYGKERDAWIARSKVVLNVHHHERAGVFEIFRVSHLLANKKCVVTEAAAARVDPALDDFAASACMAVPMERIAEQCRELARAKAVCLHLGDRGFEAFKKIDLVEGVRQALAESATLTS